MILYFDDIILDIQSKIIRYSDENSKIIKVYYWNDSGGKFDTEKHRFKYSKKILTIFDKNTLKIIDSVRQNNINIDSVILHNKTVEEKIEYFMIHNYLYIHLFDSSFLNLECKKTGDIKKENIIDVKYLGNDIIYTTEKSNNLLISSTKNCSWNGIPIGKIR
ncbi:MAG TPA: hypothetical protein V6C58_10245 [Allocoleopsis sp.]